MSIGREALNADPGLLTIGRRDKDREIRMARQSRLTVKSFLVHRFWRRHRDTPARVPDIA